MKAMSKKNESEWEFFFIEIREPIWHFVCIIMRHDLYAHEVIYCFKISQRNAMQTRLKKSTLFVLRQ